MVAHGLEEMLSPFVVAEYCRSFKVFCSEGLRPIGIKSFITNISFITILDDGHVVFCACCVPHTPQYSDLNGLLHHWDLVEDGPTFKIKNVILVANVSCFSTLLVILLTTFEIIMKDKMLSLS